MSKSEIGEVDISGMTEKTKKLAEGILSRDRRSLSRAITLVESRREDHNKQAEILIDYVLQRRRGQARRKQDKRLLNTFRLGIAGPPGAGKSTFIEALGLMLVEQGHRVAVVAIDPSSNITGGSILGDKTKMTYLSRTLNAFVRPSATSGVLGGLAQHTNDVILLCESAGFDIVLVETVGLGQSEVAVDDAADMCMLLMPPAGGDDLQGVKKGIMEIADIVVINKADGEFAAAAQHATQNVRHALQLLRPRSQNWKPKVLRCSALYQEKIDKVWGAVEQYREKMLESGEFEEKRKRQNQNWMLRQFHEQVLRAAEKNPDLQNLMGDIDSALIDGMVTPRRAANELVKTFFKKSNSE